MLRTQRKIVEVLRTFSRGAKKNPTREIIKEILRSSNDTTYVEYIPKIISRSFYKQDIIKPYKQKEHYLNLILKGAVATFVKGKNGDVCIDLAYEDELFCDCLSLLLQEQTMIKVVALEDCELLSIPYHEFVKLYTGNPQNLYIPKTMMEIVYIKKQEEQIDLLTMTPEERYLKLLDLRPEVLTRTPLKVIASYLGLTPESFSRMRKRLTIPKGGFPFYPTV